MLAGLPLAIAEELDPGTVNEQVQGTFGAAIRGLDGKRLLPAAQRRVIRNGPVQVRHLQQAGHHPGRLPQWQFEQDLDRQACVDTPACASDFVISMIK